MEQIVLISALAQVCHLPIKLHVIMYMVANIIQEILALTFPVLITVATKLSVLKINNVFTQANNVFRR
jgi:hypothetical protein